MIHKKEKSNLSKKITSGWEQGKRNWKMDLRKSARVELVQGHLVLQHPRPAARETTSILPLLLVHGWASYIHPAVILS